MKSKTWGALALVAVAGLAVYWYESPWLTLWQMQSAGKSHDAAGFNAHVDYPRLRESLKGQVSTLLAQEMGGADGNNNVGSAIGGLLGMFVADKAIDAFVRPETVMRAMQDGRLLPSLHGHKPAASSPDGGSPPSGERMQWQTEREGANRFVAYGLKPGMPREQATAFVLERHGFADWQLSELRLPQLAR